MDHLPFNTVGLNTDGIDRYYTTYSALKDNFDIQATGHIDFRLADLETFKQYTGINVRGSFVIKGAKTDCYMLFVEVDHQSATGVHGAFTQHREYQTWALAYLKHDFGRVLIRKETLADKIIELVHPVELDFKEDKAFSDIFYVVVNDHNKAVAGIDRNFRNAVMDVRGDGFVIEILDHTLIIGDREPITADRAIHLAEFVSRLCSLC
jgi:hypothetical protein